MGLPWFLAWCVVGVCLGFGVSHLGVFTLPTGAVLAILLVRSRHAGRHALGTVTGIGLVALLVGVLATDPYPPCPPGGLVLEPGQATATCGSDTMDGTPWLVAGVLITAISTLFYASTSARERAKPV